MIYRLKFIPSALKEWRKLDKNIQNLLKKKLKKRLVAPRVASARLSGFKDHYKIKLRASGYRLVYEVVEDEIYVLVIAIGRRDKKEVYKKARERKDSRQNRKSKD